MRRLEPAAIGGVMSREVANFRTFWKATTFSSVLEPVIYLLAFGLGLGATRREPRRRARLRAVRRYRDGRHGGDLLERAAGDVRHVRQGALPAHLRRDPRRAGRRGGARDRGDALDRPPFGVLRLLPAVRVDDLRAGPLAGDAAGAVLLLLHGARLRGVRHRGRRERRRRSTSSTTSRRCSSRRCSWWPARSSRSTSCPRACRSRPS